MGFILRNMFGFNWIDLIIVLILVGAVVQGIRIGILCQLFVVVGFFATLFFTGWLFPYIVRFHDPTLRTVVNASLVLLASLFVAALCLDLGRHIRWKFHTRNREKDPKILRKTETLLGGLPSFIAGVILVWLLAVMLGRMPFVGLSNSVSDARIVQQLTTTLPPVPTVFAEFGRHINPNAQPVVFVQPKPQTSFEYSTAEVQQAAAKADPSIVRITSFSCGGIVAGSGFVIGQHLVATNAHVIAGSKRPIIKYGGQSYEGVPIYFDANLDLAILKVQALDAPSLALAPSNVALDSTVAVLGYPGGNYQIEPGIIRDTRATTGTNIYNLGSFGRGIYVVQTHVDFGSSGGPIVLPNGQASGIIFSKSDDVANTAYALTSVHIQSALQRAKASQTRVSTGACTT